MSDSDSTPPQEPKISEVIVGYMYLQVALFVAIVYGMKNMEPWPYGVGRCDIIHYLYIAGFLITTLLILRNYAEGRAENLARREKIGATRTLIGRVIFIPFLSIGWYLVMTRGLTDYCETFFLAVTDSRALSKPRISFSLSFLCAVRRP